MKEIEYYNQLKKTLPFLSALIVMLCISITGMSSCSKIRDVDRNYYVSSKSGDDGNDGRSPATAWKTLDKAGRMIYQAGDKLYLDAAGTFKGKLVLQGGGTENNPVIVTSYNSENSGTRLPLIDASGYLAAIQIQNGKHFEFSNLELTSDGGEPVDAEARTRRYGVYLSSTIPGEYADFTFRNLKIHHIFATENVKGDGQNPTSNMGYGFFISMDNRNAVMKNIVIEGCTIEMTGHTGIRIFGFGDSSGSSFLEGVTIENNILTNIGGPGMVPGRCRNVVVRNNVTDHTGSSADPRMHARGSGIWPWTCTNVLIEKNKFMHARGKNDSCGTHIDFNCNHVVVQYNLSMDNAGGFVEILGNDSNCCYRYNISINDGFRIKGTDGAQQDGHILWTSGYTGTGNQRKGPFNSYIYNNTIYVKEDIRSTFSFATTTEGILIANNIFHVTGSTVVSTEVAKKTVSESELTIPNVVFTNNLYKNAQILPETLIITDSKPIIGDPGFRKPGGLDPADYVPANTALITNKGVKITVLPGDNTGLKIGLEVKTDFFGKPITGMPDMGAIEL